MCTRQSLTRNLSLSPGGYRRCLRVTQCGCGLGGYGGEEGKRERGGEKKRKREEERTAFVYTESVLFHQGSEMANSFLRVYQGNWMQNQPRPQK